MRIFKLFIVILLQFTVMLIMAISYFPFQFFGSVFSLAMDAMDWTCSVRERLES